MSETELAPSDQGSPEFSNEPAPGSGTDWGSEIEAFEIDDLESAGLLQPLLIAAVVTALVMGFVVMARLLAPQPAWRFLPITAFLVALEGVYTTYWLYHPDRRQLNRGRYRIAEFIVIALLLRLVSWALTGGLPGLETWRGYLLSPLSFIDSVYFVYMLCAFFAWERAIVFSIFFIRLAVSHAEVAYYLLPRDQQLRQSADRPIDRARPHVFESLVKNWLGGGMVLALFAALTTVDLTSVVESESLRTITRLGLQPEMLLSLLVYFLVGLWLISRARLIMMRARWLVDGVQTKVGTARAWRRTTLALLIVVALIAAFLPIGSTFGIAPLLELLMGLMLSLVQLFFLLMTFLFMTVLSLLGLNPPNEEELDLGPASPAPPTTPVPNEPLSETSALVIGGLFWVVIAVVALLALLFFLRDRGYPINLTLFERWWRGLLSWLRGLWRGASERAVTLRHEVRLRLNSLAGNEGESASPWRFIRVNALPPRERVRYFYLSTVRRAGEKGVEREQSETPREFAGDLKENWPDAEVDIDLLTQAFLEARYSPQPIDEEDVNPVKQVWKRVRASLRRRQQKGEQAADDD